MSITGRNRRRQNNPDISLDDLPEFMDEPGEKELSEKSSVVVNNENAPIEVLEFLAEAGVPNQFTCHIYKTGTNGKKSLQAKLDSQTLDENEIGRRYGSGDYNIHLQWKYLGSEGEVKKGTKWFSMTLGPEFDVSHAKYRRENLEIITATTPQNNVPQLDPLATIKALTDMMPKPVEQKSSMDSIVGLVSAFTPIVLQMISENNKRQDEANKRLERILEKIGEKKEDDFMTFIEKMKVIKEVFPEPEIKPDGGDKLDRVIDGAFELIKTMGPQMIARANAPVVGGFVRQQIAQDPRWEDLINDEATRTQALDHLYSTMQKSEVDKFLIGMNVPQFVRG